MTKQEAIEQVRIVRSNLKNKFRRESMDEKITKEYLDIFKDKFEALEMAIKALEQQDICYCKDCRLLVDDGHCKLHSYGVDWILYPDADTDFCSWGERGEN